MTVINNRALAGSRDPARRSGGNRRGSAVAERIPLADLTVAAWTSRYVAALHAAGGALTGKALRGITSAWRARYTAGRALDALVATGAVTIVDRNTPTARACGWRKAHYVLTELIKETN